MNSFGISTVFTFVVYIAVLVVFIHSGRRFYKPVSYNARGVPSVYVFKAMCLLVTLGVLATIFYSVHQMKVNGEDTLTAKAQSTTFSIYTITVGAVLSFFLVFISAYITVYGKGVSYYITILVMCYLLFGIGVSNFLTNI